MGDEGHLAYDQHGGSRARQQLIHILDTATGRELMKLDGHTDSIFGLAVTPDAGALLSGSFDKTARLWDLTSGRQLHRWTLDASCLATVVTRDGAMFASTESGTVMELMTSSGRWPVSP